MKTALRGKVHSTKYLPKVEKSHTSEGSKETSLVPPFTWESYLLKIHKRSLTFLFGVTIVHCRVIVRRHEALGSKKKKEIFVFPMITKEIKLNVIHNKKQQYTSNPIVTLYTLGTGFGLSHWISSQEFTTQEY